MLLGYPITINQDVASMAASATSILFGDFSFYTIRDAMAVEMFRFTDSAYTKLGQVGFLAWMRSGGNLIDVGGAVKLFVNAAS
jgi:HK97 family phage major capsid protein